MKITQARRSFMSILLKEKDFVIDSKRKPLTAIYAEYAMSNSGLYV